nr:hypothetical protein [Pseudoalteromonas sp. P1-13-1a]
MTVIRNKANLSGDAVGMDENQPYQVISLSAATRSFKGLYW